MKELFSLEGKIALVTGAAQGIGRAVALAFAESGANVALADLQAEKAEKVKKEVEELGQKAIVIEINLQKLDQINAMVDTTVRELGDLHIMANIAGVNVHKAAEEMTEKDWDFVQEINLKALFFCCQAAGKHMLKKGYGKIINMSSTFGIVGFGYRTAYASSKAAVSNLTKTLALEWSDKGINVNALAPGPVWTPAREKLFSDPDFMKKLLAKVPINRVAEPIDIAWPAVFLASEAAKYITGETLLVDGGFCAQ